MMLVFCLFSGVFSEGQIVVVERLRKFVPHNNVGGKHNARPVRLA